LSKLVMYGLRAFAITVAVALTAAAAAARAGDADELVATRSDPGQAPSPTAVAPPPQPAAAPMTTEQQIDAWINHAPPVTRMSRDDAESWTDRPVVAENDGRVHGEVGAMIGTGGSRAVFGTATIPLGDKAHATVSITDGHKLPYAGPYADPRYAPYPPF
jgi:hypothetical protein